MAVKKLEIFQMKEPTLKNKLKAEGITLSGKESHKELANLLFNTLQAKELNTPIKPDADAGNASEGAADAKGEGADKAGEQKPTGEGLDEAFERIAALEDALQGAGTVLSNQHDMLTQIIKRIAQIEKAAKGGAAEAHPANKGKLHGSIQSLKHK